MVKAKKVKGIRCDAPAVENARRIITVRLDEMMSFAPYVHQPENIEEIHDLRIAAKRLRYTLEMFRFAFPKGLNKLIKEVKSVQQAIGDMRDADVMIDRVSQALSNQNANRTLKLMDIASATERGTVSQRRHRLKSAITSPTVPREELVYYTLIAHRTDDSVEAYQRFIDHWDEMTTSDFPGRLRQFVGIEAQPAELVEDETLETDESEQPELAEAVAENGAGESTDTASPANTELVEEVLVAESPAQENPPDPSESSE